MDSPNEYLVEESSTPRIHIENLLRKVGEVVIVVTTVSRQNVMKFVDAAGGPTGLRIIGLTSLDELFDMPPGIPVLSQLAIDEGDEGRVFGWLIVRVSNNCATLFHLFVGGQYRELGWGEKLMRSGIAAIFAMDGLSEIEAVILTGNETPRRLCQRLGFTESPIVGLRDAIRPGQGMVQVRLLKKV